MNPIRDAKPMREFPRLRFPVDGIPGTPAFAPIVAWIAKKKERKNRARGGKKKRKRWLEGQEQ